MSEREIELLWAKRYVQALAKAITNRRKRKRLTIGELAAKSGLDAADIERWEQGLLDDVTLVDTLLLAKALKYGAKSLFSDAEESLGYGGFKHA
jgi:transcriptional regulator with XRE-family HTH domain